MAEQQRQQHHLECTDSDSDSIDILRQQQREEVEGGQGRAAELEKTYSEEDLQDDVSATEELRRQLSQAELEFVRSSVADLILRSSDGSKAIDFDGVIDTDIDYDDDEVDEPDDDLRRQLSQAELAAETEKLDIEEDTDDEAAEPEDLRRQLSQAELEFIRTSVADMVLRSSGGTHGKEIDFDDVIEEESYDDDDDDEESGEIVFSRVNYPPSSIEFAMSSSLFDETDQVHEITTTEDGEYRRSTRLFSPPASQDFHASKMGSPPSIQEKTFSKKKRRAHNGKPSRSAKNALFSSSSLEKASAYQGFHHSRHRASDEEEKQEVQEHEVRTDDEELLETIATMEQEARIKQMQLPQHQQQRRTSHGQEEQQDVPTCPPMTRSQSSSDIVPPPCAPPSRVQSAPLPPRVQRLTTSYTRQTLDQDDKEDVEKTSLSLQPGAIRVLGLDASSDHTRNNYYDSSGEFNSSDSKKDASSSVFNSLVRRSHVRTSRTSRTSRSSKGSFFFICQGEAYVYDAEDSLTSASFVDMYDSLFGSSEFHSFSQEQKDYDDQDTDNGLDDIGYGIPVDDEEPQRNQFKSMAWKRADSRRRRLLKEQLRNQTRTPIVLDPAMVLTIRKNPTMAPPELKRHTSGGSMSAMSVVSEYMIGWNRPVLVLVGVFIFCILVVGLVVVLSIAISPSDSSTASTPPISWDVPTTSPTLTSNETEQDQGNRPIHRPPNLPLNMPLAEVPYSMCNEYVPGWMTRSSGSCDVNKMQEQDNTQEMMTNSSSSVLGSNFSHPVGSDAGVLVAHAIRQGTVGDIVIQNAGVCASDISNGSFTSYDAQLLLPNVGNPLAHVTLTGYEIVAVLENALEKVFGEEQEQYCDCINTCTSSSCPGCGCEYPYSSGLRFHVDSRARLGSRTSGWEVQRTDASMDSSSTSTNTTSFELWVPLGMEQTFKVVLNYSNGRRFGRRRNGYLMLLQLHPSLINQHTSNLNSFFNDELETTNMSSVHEVTNGNNTTASTPTGDSSTTSRRSIFVTAVDATTLFMDYAWQEQILERRPYHEYSTQSYIPPLSN